jgi:HAD superfamily hydrolase (TIGR01509 family)
VKNIVFDLGNVLFRFDPKEILDDLFEEELIKKKIIKDVFKTKIWADLDRGTISYNDACRIWLNNNPDLKSELMLLLENWHKYLTPIEENISFLYRLKSKGKNLYVLSNFHEHAFNYIRTHYSFFELFDGMVISYQVKLLKPEKEIYNLLIENYNLIPEQTIFIDDSLENVKAAEEVGIKGILYLNSEELYKQLDGL